MTWGVTGESCAAPHPALRATFSPLCGEKGWGGSTRSISTVPDYEVSGVKAQALFSENQQE
jgi:hypothetical protein